MAIQEKKFKILLFLITIERVGTEKKKVQIERPKIHIQQGYCVYSRTLMVGIYSKLSQESEVYCVNSKLV